MYEHGWQSWSPAGVYAGSTACSPRPRKHIWQAMAFRPELPAPDIGFQAEGLLAVVNADGIGGGAASPASPDRRGAVDPCARRGWPSRRRRRTAPVEHLHAASLDDGLAAVGDAACGSDWSREPVQAAAGGLVLLVHVLEPGHRAGHPRQPRGDRRAGPRHRGRAGRRRLPARTSATGSTAAPASATSTRWPAASLDTGPDAGTVDGTVPRRSGLGPRCRRTRTGSSGEQWPASGTGTRRSACST